MPCAAGESVADPRSDGRGTLAQWLDLKDVGEHKTIVGNRYAGGGSPVPFALSQHDRRQHLYTIGKTGTGKSTLLLNLILEDIYAGKGVGLIDPHGDLATAVLEHIPASLAHRVVLLDARDTEHPVSYNFLQDVPKEERPRVASSFVSALKGIWADSWGPRLEYILYASIAALLDCKNVTLLGVQRMLVDPGYRAWVVRQVEDPMVRFFWEHEFASYDKKFLQEAIAPIQNKVGHLLLSPTIRNIFGQVTKSFDVDFMMNDGRIFIASLSKGAIGADSAHLLGALLVSEFAHAALRREAIPEGERRDFNLYIDEFQNFTTSAFESILSEARKYGLCLTLSHQYLGQLPEALRQAVLGNVGSLIAFRVGAEDASLLEREFAGDIRSRELVELENFEIGVRAVEDGRQRAAFRGRTRAPARPYVGRKRTFIELSRTRYARSRREVEDRIRRWLSR
jgi:hypothetical protein